MKIGQKSEKNRKAAELVTSGVLTNKWLNIREILKNKVNDNINAIYDIWKEFENKVEIRFIGVVKEKGGVEAEMLFTLHFYVKKIKSHSSILVVYRCNLRAKEARRMREKKF